MITNKDELLSFCDIVSVVENFIPLKRYGANYKACCPFHNEDTPSFVVSQNKGIFKCFGCGKSGDVVAFVQEFKRIDFVEALEEIANITNFTLIYDKSYEKKDYKPTIENVNAFYMQNINKAKEYLVSRGVNEDSIKKFELGFAPSNKDQLEYFANSLLNQDYLRDLGITSIKKDKIYARITNRLTFPTRNHSGKLVGFSGRILPKDKREAKYLNSPQTKLYDKSNLLYGYFQAKDNIYKKKVITIVEGHLDVILLHQAGFNTSVGLGGTALTSQHILKLIKKTDAKVLLCLDNDRAGREATQKAAKLLSSYEIDGGVVVLDEGQDPADMIQDGKKKELLKSFANAMPFVKYVLFYIKSLYDLSNPIQKSKCLKECQSFLKSLNPVIANEYLNYLSNLLSIDKRHITQAKNTPLKQINSKHNISELNIIATALSRDDFKKAVLTKLHEDMFINHKKEFKLLQTNPKELDWIFCLDDINPYKGSTLKEALELFIINYKTRKTSEILKQNISIKEKISLINNLKL